MENIIKKKFYIETYGCQMNRSDSTSIMHSLIANNFKKVDSIENADIIIINTCSIRDHAENRALTRISTLASIRKKTNSKFKIAVTGCMARSAYEKLRLRGADYIFDVYEQSKMHYYLSDENYKHSENNFGYDYEFKTCYLDEHYKHKAYLPITHGCDNWCTYCIVPHTRGPMASRNSMEIIKEFKKLVDEGAKEITLLGQNVNSYGIDNNDINFVKLLYQLDKYAENKSWIRFMTSHPKDFSKELAMAVLDLKSVCSHLHLPLQSANDRILEIMNRKYTKQEYIEKVNYLRKNDDTFALSTDIIVGFADETDTEFEETLKMLEHINYEEAYLYRYSERKGTIAEKKSIIYDEDKAKERLNILIDMQRNISKKRLAQSVNKNMLIMIESIAKDKKHYLSRSYENRTVLLDINDKKKYRNGDIIMAKTYDIVNYSLLAKEL